MFISSQFLASASKRGLISLMSHSPIVSDMSGYVHSRAQCIYSPTLIQAAQTDLYWGVRIFD